MGPQVLLVRKVTGRPGEFSFLSGFSESHPLWSSNPLSAKLLSSSLARRIRKQLAIEAIERDTPYTYKIDDPGDWW